MNLFVLFILPPVLLPYTIILSFLLLALLILLPFIPGIRELCRPKDPLPLSIEMDYSKNPRYFDRAFKGILEKSLEKVGYENGLKHVRLSKDELVEVSDLKTVPDNENISNILYVKGNFVSGKRTQLNKELYVKGAATIGENSILRGLSCDGNVILSRGTRVIRWVGAEGNISVSPGCSLGVLCACNGVMDIGKGCAFKALYGNPITTYEEPQGYGRGNPENEAIKMKTMKRPARRPDAKEAKNIEDLVWYISGKNFSIPPFSMVEDDLVCKNSLTLEKGCIITGSLKVYGNVVLEENVTVNGNIFAEGEITIGANCSVTGNIFSQSIIRVAGNGKIGKAGATKSIIGKKGVELTHNTLIFGYILTEGSGKIS